MGYSKHPRAVTRVKNYLADMAARNDKIMWIADDPSKLAYQIREGITVARKIAIDKDKKPVEPYASFGRLNAKYIIRTQGQHVIAEPRDVIPLQAIKASFGKITLRGLTDQFEIMGAAIEHHAQEMYFPDASTDETVLKDLFEWASKNEYSIIPHMEGLTLTRYPVGDLAWKPE